MNALIFAAIPVIALLVVAILGLLWLREPVDEKPGAQSGNDTVAEALARLEDVSRRVEALAGATQPSAKAKRDARAAVATRAKAG